MTKNHNFLVSHTVQKHCQRRGIGKRESFEFLKIIMKLINGLNTNIRWELQRKEKRKPKQRISMPESPQRRCSYTSSSKIFARTYTHRGGGISPDKYQKVPWCSCPQSNLWWKNNISSLSEGFQFHQECKAPVDLRKQRQFSNHC